MRCKACDNKDVTRFHNWLGDWYCFRCASSIMETINEDNQKDNDKRGIVSPFLLDKEFDK